MNSHFQVKAYAEADFSDTDKEIIRKLDDFIKQSRKQVNEDTLIIDLGCGPGNIAERLALHWPFTKTIGIDGAHEMIQVAKRRARDLRKRTGLNNLSYLHSNISLLASGVTSLNGSADVVVSNSLMHHIHKPKIFWNAIKNVSSKGSVHYHRDLRRPGSSEEAFSLQKKFLPNAPIILKKDYVASLHAAFTSEEIRVQLDLAGLNRLKVFEVDERYLEVVGIF